MNNRIYHPPTLKDQFDLIGALWVSSFSFILLSFYVLPSLHWHDSAEFIANAHTLSLAHPPGHPLTLITMHIAQLLPFLDLNMRSNLLSAAWIAMAVGILYQVTYTLCMDSYSKKLKYTKLINDGIISNQDVPDSTTSDSITPDAFNKVELSIRIVSALWSISLALIPMVYLQAIRSEVYAAQCALSTFCMGCYLWAYLYQDKRFYLGMAFGFALLSANHIFLAALFVLACLPFLCWQKLSWKVWISAFCFSVLGLQLYWYVWLRGQSGDLYAWGWVDDLSSFYQTVSAQIWRQKVAQRVVEIDWTSQWARMAWFWIKQIGVFTTISVMLITVIQGVRRCRFTLTRFLSRSFSDSPTHTSSSISPLSSEHLLPTNALLMFFIVLFTTLIWSKLSYPFVEVNPDFSGYLASAVPVLMTYIFLMYLHLPSRYMFLCVAMTVISIGIKHNYQARDLSYGAEGWGKILSKEVPAQGLLWTSHYESHFITQNLRVTQGWRVDVTSLFKGHQQQVFLRHRFMKHPAQLYIPHRQSWGQYISSPSSMYYDLARIEVPAIEETPSRLWPYLRLQGLTFQYAPWYHSSPLALRHLAPYYQSIQRTFNPHYNPYDLQSNPIKYDLDSAYHWALYHEAHLRFLHQQISLYRTQHATESRSFILPYFLPSSSFPHTYWTKESSQPFLLSHDLSYHLSYSTLSDLVVQLKLFTDLQQQQKQHFIQHIQHLQSLDNSSF